MTTAVLLATGETRRLSPLSDAVPSPLLPVLNKPVIAVMVEGLARQGVKKMVVCLYDRGESIEAYFGSGRRWGVEIDYAPLRQPLGSAGALKWVERSVDGTALLIPAEVIFDIDVAAALEAHRASGCLLTRVVRSSDVGPGNQVPTGAFLVEPAALSLVPPRVQSDVESDLVPALSARGNAVGSYPTDAYWNPLASFRDYVEAHWFLLAQARPITEQDLPATRGPDSFSHFQAEGRRLAEGIWVGRDCVIHPTAKIASPVYIGDNCRIGREVELGPRAVIGSRAVVADLATVQDSIIWDSTYIGELVNVSGRIASGPLVVDAATGESLSVPDRFLIGSTHAGVSASALIRAADFLVAATLLLLSLPIMVPIALLCLLLLGRVFDPAERMAPARGEGDVAKGSPREMVSLLRFRTHGRGGSSSAYGQWLERWELHRIPELWTVLVGKLAFVGVKPLTAEEDQMVTESWQLRRYEHPAGLTGLWYVQTSPNAELLDILVADAYYVATRSWRVDLSLLWSTPAAWARRRAAGSA
jgi:NDP-sugar pyrophosphorylase family protein